MNNESVFEKPLQDLRVRAQRLHARSSITGLGGVALAIMGAVVFILSLLAEPSAAIDQIEVPSVVAQAFITSQEFHSVFNETSVLPVASVLFSGTTVKAISVVIIAIGLLQTIVRQSIIYTVVPVLAAVALNGLVAILGFDSDVASPRTNQLDAAIESGDLQRVQELFSSHDLDTVATGYVLAQVALVSGTPSPSLAATAKNLRENKLQGAFNVDPQIAYAIESSALASTEQSELSTIARQYLEDTNRMSELLKIISVVSAGIAAILLVVASACFFLMSLIMRRVSRITGLLHDL